MHRDLKLENIMMNDAFESKIIDFGLVRESNVSRVERSLTTGIGTLSYMSPEEEYDSKTDIYSYGVVLFALFSGEVLKQKMRKRMNNVPFEFPPEWPSMSKYRIDLIKRCMSFDPSKRPILDEIAGDKAKHSFALASEIDTKSVFTCSCKLNIIKKRMQTDNASSE